MRRIIKNKLKLILGAAAILTAVLALAIFLVPELRNQALLRFASPAEYYTRTEARSLKQRISAWTAAYAVSPAEQLHTDFRLSIDIQQDNRTKSIESDIWFTISKKENSFYIQVESIPGAYLKFNIDDLNKSISFKDITLASLFSEEALSAERLGNILTHYSDMVIDFFDRIQISRNRNGNKLTVSFTSDELLKLAISLLSQAKNDPDILAAAEKAGNLNSTELSSLLSLLSVQLERSWQSVPIFDVDMLLLVDPAGMIMERSFLIRCAATAASLEITRASRENPELRPEYQGFDLFYLEEIEAFFKYTYYQDNLPMTRWYGPSH